MSARKAIWRALLDVDVTPGAVLRILYSCCWPWRLHELRSEVCKGVRGGQGKQTDHEEGVFVKIDCWNTLSLNTYFPQNIFLFKILLCEGLPESEVALCEKRWGDCYHWQNYGNLGKAKPLKLKDCGSEFAESIYISVLLCVVHTVWFRPRTIALIRAPLSFCFDCTCLWKAEIASCCLICWPRLLTTSKAVKGEDITPEFAWFAWIAGFEITPSFCEYYLLWITSYDMEIHLEVSRRYR